MAALHPNWGFQLLPLDGKNWRLLKDWDVNLSLKFPGEKKRTRIQVRMPKGFEYDGSSAPPFLWRLMPPMTGLHLRADLVHDVLYVDKACWIDGEYRKIPREWADWIFRHIMLADGYPSWKAKGAYSAVVAFGKRAWET